MQTRDVNKMKLVWRSLVVAGVIIAVAQSASAAGSCDVTFRLVSAADSPLLAVTVMVNYESAAGEFEGQVAEVNHCDRPRPDLDVRDWALATADAVQPVAVMSG